MRIGQAADRNRSFSKLSRLAAEVHSKDRLLGIAHHEVLKALADMAGAILPWLVCTHYSKAATHPDHSAAGLAACQGLCCSAHLCHKLQLRIFREPVEPHYTVGEVQNHLAKAIPANRPPELGCIHLLRSRQRVTR